MIWSSENFEKKIYEVLDNNPLTEINIIMLACSTPVANEFFDILATLRVPETGLKKIMIGNELFGFGEAQIG